MAPGCSLERGPEGGRCTLGVLHPSVCVCVLPPSCWFLSRSLQEACGGSQPLVTIYEGQSLRFGACVVDVQAATVSFASWQVGFVGGAGRGSPCGPQRDGCSAKARRLRPALVESGRLAAPSPPAFLLATLACRRLTLSCPCWGRCC